MIDNRFDKYLLFCKVSFLAHPVYIYLNPCLCHTIFLMSTYGKSINQFDLYSIDF